MMPSCPRCNFRIKETQTVCPQCRSALTAYGHPGIPLHRATEDSFLCQTCVYELDDTCTFPQRPHAETCTLFRDVRTPRQSAKRLSRTKVSGGMSADLRSHLWWFGLLCIVGLAVLLAL